MKSYIIKQPEKDEILGSNKILLLSFGREILDGLEEEKKLWIQLIYNNIARFLIAIEIEKILGIGGLFPFQQVGSIGYLGVLPEYRSQRVDSEIFRKLMKMAISLGCKTVVLYASKLGEPVYRKYGFQGKYCASMY